MSDNAAKQLAAERARVSQALARRSLGIPGKATPEQIRGIIAAKLESSQFLPPPKIEQAVLLLSDSLPLDLWSRGRGSVLFRPREVALRQKAAQFAGRFFSIPPDERRTQWQSLAVQCGGFVTLESWMEALAVGLDVMPPTLADDKTLLVDLLAKELCRIFVMPPAERAAWQTELIRQSADDPRRWQAAARELKSRCPQLVPLLPTLMNSMTQCVRTVKMAKKAARKEAAANAAAKRKTADFSLRRVLVASLVVAIPLVFLLSLLFVFLPPDTGMHSASSRSSSDSFNWVRVVGPLVGVFVALFSRVFRNR